MLEKQVEISIDQRAIVAAVTRFAEMAHRGQTRKYTVEPYIVHPVRVMEICRQVTCDTKVLCAALLHDVLEDTAVTAYEIHSYLYALLGTPGAKQTLDLVVELTDVYTKSAYPEWNRRKRKEAETERLAGISPAAQTIKYADILDNITAIVLNDPGFARVFVRESDALLKRLDQGDEQLYERAKETLRRVGNRL